MRRARFRGPKPTRRRAPNCSPIAPQEGCTEAVMLANGFTVRAGLATATADRCSPPQYGDPDPHNAHKDSGDRGP